MKHRLARLERATRTMAGRRCPRCGGTPGGVARVPIVIFNGDETTLGAFAPDGRCSNCGSVPSHVVRIVTPLFACDRGEGNAARSYAG